ncbi:hypothetical protein ABIA51_001739 [Erwinia aphidicola]|nr:hypothetical protein [Erwinia aphidicola]
MMKSVINASAALALTSLALVSFLYIWFTL